MLEEILMDDFGPSKSILGSSLFQYKRRNCRMSKIAQNWDFIKIVLEFYLYINDRSNSMEMLLGRFSDRNKASEVVFMKLICMSVESKNHKSEFQNPLRILPLTFYFGTSPDILGKNCEFVTSRNAKSLLRNAKKGIFILVLVFSRFYWTYY